MTTPLPNTPVSPLRQKLIDDMNMRHCSVATQRNYIRDVGRFASFLRRPPDTATTEDVRQFQLAQSEAGVPVPTMNSVVSALRFFFTNTLDRPDLARKLVRVSRPRNLPVVLSRDEVARLLNATTSLKHQAALSVAYGAGLRVGEVAMLKARDINSERMLIRVERSKAGNIAMPCSHPTCSPCCGNGGRSAIARACCTATAGCFLASTLSSQSAPGSSIVWWSRQR